MLLRNTLWSIYPVLIFIFAANSSLAGTEGANSTTVEGQNSYFLQLKTKLFADPYTQLPQYQVTRKLFDQNGKNLLLADAKRTLRSKADLVSFPAGQKLLQRHLLCGRLENQPAKSVHGFIESQYRTTFDRSSLGFAQWHTPEKQTCICLGCKTLSPSRGWRACHYRELLSYA